MKYRAKKCIFDPCFMLYVPDLLLWKVHLACIPAISTGTPRKSLWKQIIQQLERNRIKSESMGAPGRRATCHLSDFAETWPV